MAPLIVNGISTGFLQITTKTSILVILEITRADAHDAHLQGHSRMVRRSKAREQLSEVAPQSKPSRFPFNQQQIMKQNIQRNMQRQTLLLFRSIPGSPEQSVDIGPLHCKCMIQTKQRIKPSPIKLLLLNNASSPTFKYLMRTSGKVGIIGIAREQFSRHQQSTGPAPPPWLDKINLSFLDLNQFPT